MCRSEGSLSADIRKKIALFASLPSEAIVSACDVDNIYKVPLTFHEQGVDDFLLEHFGVDAPAPDLSPLDGADRTRRAGAGARCGSRSSASTCSSRTPTCRCPRRCATPPRCRTAGCRSTGSTPRAWRAATSRRSRDRLGDADGILSPAASAGAGSRARSRAARFAREQRIPYLGICLGMQVAVAEFARHVAGMDGANSTEFDIETPFPVIDLLPEQKEVADLGGTMRLGADPIKLHAGGRALARCTARRSSTSATATATRSTTACASACRAPACASRAPRPTSAWWRSIELDEHPFFVASQFHPEFKSRPERPAPLFRDFVAAALARAGTGTSFADASHREQEQEQGQQPSPTPAQRAGLS